MIFTGGIGENAPVVRQKSCQGLGFLGIAISRKKNEANQNIISTGRVKVMVIPTNEELAIARDTKRILLSERRKRESLEETAKEVITEDGVTEDYQRLEKRKLEVLN